MLYYGAEYCPYCAAERWAMAAALSRFGTWSNLKITASSHTDVDAATHTFSFHGATFTSPYLTFAGVEQYSNIPTAVGELHHPREPDQGGGGRSSPSTARPSTSRTRATSGGISFPFIDINNVALISGASYDPGILAGLSWTDIAGGLADPTNPVTQAIVGDGQLHVRGHLRQHQGRSRLGVHQLRASRPRPRRWGSARAERRPPDDRHRRPCPPCAGNRSPPCS